MVTYPPRNLVRDAVSEIAQYVGWLEHEYNTKSEPLINTSAREDWYLRRLSWVHRLIHVLEIPVQEVAKDIRLPSNESAESGFNPMDNEEHIEHFLSSWARFERTYFT